jgi:hypothetical protein
MAWYRQGSISVTNGSATVTGSGTQWIANAAIGEGLRAPDGRIYEIINIASNTSLTITPNYLGSNQSGQAYEIVPTQSFLRDLAAQAADLVNQYSTIANTVGQGKFADGTAGTPGIRFNDDPDTGLYRIGANILGISAGGGERFRATSTGVQATGTLTATGNTSLANLSYTGTLTGGTGVINIGSGQISKNTAGNVGIGTASPGSLGSAITTLNILGTNGGGVLMSRTAATESIGALSAGNGNFYLRSTNAVPLLFGTDNAERMRIDSSGNVGIGTSSPTARLHIVPTVGSTSIYAQTGTATNNTSAPVITAFNTNSPFEGRIELIRGSSSAATGWGFVVANGSTPFEAARIQPNGNVGIGETNPSTRLDVAESTVNEAIQVRASDGSGAGHIGSNGSAGTSTSLAISASRASGSIVFKSGGFNERMRIDSSGNVLVGQSSTATPGTGNTTAGVGIRGDGYSSFSRSGNPTVGFNRSTSDGSVVTLRREGSEVGSISVTTTATAYNTSGASGITGVDANTVAVRTNSAERMRIDSSGNVLVGTTSVPTGSSNGTRFLGGLIDTSRDITTLVKHFRLYNPNGEVGSISTSGTATAYTTSSDQRLKDNITDAPSASDSIDAVKIRSFDWKADGSHQKFGVIAQELEAVAPEAVSKGENEDDMWGVDYSKLVPMLIKEVQSLRARVAQLEGN